MNAAGSPAAANPRPNPAKGSQLNAVHPTRVHAPKPPKQERDARMPAIPSEADPSEQLDPNGTASAQDSGTSTAIPSIRPDGDQAHHIMKRPGTPKSMLQQPNLKAGLRA